MAKQPAQILVVDDERDMGSFVCSVAKSLGFTAASAGNTNELKIDQTFISKLDSDSECRSITKTSIALAHELNMKVVAEGIESEKVGSILGELGCDEGQGYWIGRPMEGDQFLGWLDGWQSKSE